MVTLDGYLCGVLAQPEIIETSRWLPPALDWNHGDPDASEPVARRSAPTRRAGMPRSTSACWR